MSHRYLFRKVSIRKTVTLGCFSSLEFSLGNRDQRHWIALRTLEKASLVSAQPETAQFREVLLDTLSILILSEEVLGFKG